MFVLDEIEGACGSSQNGEVPEEWLQLAGWDPWSQNCSSPNLPDRLWRTLVADPGENGANARTYYPVIFKYAVESSTDSNGLEASELSKKNNSLLVEFLERMKAVVWERELFLSKRDTDLGLAPKHAQNGECETCPPIFD